MKLPALLGGAGAVILAGNLASSAAMQVAAARPATASDPKTMTIVMATGFGTTLAALLFAYRTKGQAPQTQMVLPTASSWTGDSWAANLVVIGSVLTTIAGLGNTSATFRASARMEYVVLATLLATIVTLAGAVHTMARNVRQPESKLRVAAVLASTLVFWPAFTQVLTLWMLLDDLQAASVLHWGVVWMMDGLLIAAGVALWFYARAVYWAAFTAWPPVSPVGAPPPPGAKSAPSASGSFEAVLRHLP